MSWDLDAEHRDFQAVCRRFVDRPVRPAVYEAEALGRVPQRLWKELGAAGLLGLLTPEEYGGSGGDQLAVALPGAGYRLNGRKMFITNAGVADVLIVAAKTAPDAGRRGISTFLVEAPAPGLSLGAPLTALQSVRHRLAAMAAELESARLMTYREHAMTEAAQ